MRAGHAAPTVFSYAARRLLVRGLDAHGETKTKTNAWTLPNTHRDGHDLGRQLVMCHQRHRFWLQDAHALEFAALPNHLQEPHVITRRRYHAAATGQELWFGEIRAHGSGFRIR